MIASVILAAGSAMRMGKPKQILPLGAKTILEHVIEQAQHLSERIYIVLGAALDQVVEHIPLDDHIRLIENAEHREGMASSIRAAVSIIQRDIEVEAFLLMLGDQPILSLSIGQTLLQNWQTNHAEVVVPQYGEQFGNPVVFARSSWNQLMQLQGDTGARSLIQQNAFPSMSACVFPADWQPMDCDTPEDYAALLQAYQIIS